MLCFCFVFLRLVYSMLPVSLDCPFLITPSVYSTLIVGYLDLHLLLQSIYIIDKTWFFLLWMQLKEQELFSLPEHLISTLRLFGFWIIWLPNLLTLSVPEPDLMNVVLETPSCVFFQLSIDCIVCPSIYASDFHFGIFKH
jgi:hypothetical protein